MLRSDLPIPLPFVAIVDYDDVEGLDCDQGPADLGRFIIPFKCEVYRADCVVTETCAGSVSTPVVDFDLRPTVASDVDRGAADIAHIALSTTAAGKTMYDEAGKGTVLEPGEEVIVELATQAVDGGGLAAGHVLPVLLVKYLPETEANMADMVETA